MTSRKTIISAVVGVAALMLAFFAAPAMAQDPYPPTGPQLVIDTPSVVQGGVLKGHVTGFDPGTATATFNPSFTFTVAADGTGSFEYPMPCDVAVGDYTLTATSGATTASGMFAVTPGCATATTAPAGGASGDLPRTGTDASLPMTQTAVAAIAAGGLMVLVANRRRKATV